MKFEIDHSWAWEGWREIYISEVVRIGSSIIIFQLSKLWKAKFFILCDVIFLVRLQEEFGIDHSWEWNGGDLITQRFSSHSSSNAVKFCHYKPPFQLASMTRFQPIAAVKSRYNEPPVEIFVSAIVYNTLVPRKSKHTASLRKLDCLAFIPAAATATQTPHLVGRPQSPLRWPATRQTGSYRLWVRPRVTVATGRSARRPVPGARWTSWRARPRKRGKTRKAATPVWRTFGRRLKKTPFWTPSGRHTASRRLRILISGEFLCVRVFIFWLRLACFPKIIPKVSRGVVARLTIAKRKKRFGINRNQERTMYSR